MPKPSFSSKMGKIKPEMENSTFYVEIYYNPRLKQWTVEVPLSHPRHKSCAVTIDDRIVVTGGTSLGLGKFKPQWLAEIGTRRTELFDGQT